MLRKRIKLATLSAVIGLGLFTSSTASAQIILYYWDETGIVGAWQYCESDGSFYSSWGVQTSTVTYGYVGGYC